MKIKNILIVGGTHGNEWTGVYIVRKYAESIRKEFPNLNVQFEIGNPDAFKLNKRYEGFDLNRIFNSEEEKTDYAEAARARFLKKRIKGLSPCLIIDLHTTTSNMGRSLIITAENEFNDYVLSKVKNVKIIHARDEQKKHLISQNPFGFIIEIGPVHQSVIDLRAVKNMLDLIKEILRIISRDKGRSRRSVVIYREVEEIHYPKNKSGDIEAAISQTFLGKDFKKQKKIFCPFTRFDGDEIRLKRNENLYPIFINESSYYPQNLAFILCRKTRKLMHGDMKDASRC